MKSNHIQQVRTQKLGQGSAQGSYIPICNSQVAGQLIKCVSPITFSQKLYQFNALNLTVQEIANQNYEQALTEANSLEEVKELLQRIIALAD